MSLPARGPSEVARAPQREGGERPVRLPLIRSASPHTELTSWKQVPPPVTKSTRRQYFSIISTVRCAIEAIHQERHVVLRVEDNGPGFPPVLARLFEPFFTTQGSEKGTGLGMALSRERVERFGGSLVAESRAEGGACLRLSLRCASSLNGSPPEA